MKVNILGTEYTIERHKRSEDPKLKDYDGYCDSSVKRIVVESKEEGPNSVENLRQCEDEILRHEIVHAFLDESGLRTCTYNTNHGWARNEELVDWIALQAPKLFKAFRQADCI